MQDQKAKPLNIPVSCFTATAKQAVVDDIKSYFKDKLNLNLEVYRANAARVNLHYHILPESDRSEKDLALRKLLTDMNCSSASISREGSRKSAAT